AKCIACGDDDLLAVVLHRLGELGDARRLAGAVDAGDHHDRRSFQAVADAVLRRGEQALELVLDELLDVAGDLLVLECLADAGDDLLCGDRTNIREIQPFFKLVEEILIDASLKAEEVHDAAEEAARPGQALLDLVENRTKNHRTCLSLTRRIATLIHYL